MDASEGNQLCSLRLGGLGWEIINKRRQEKLLCRSKQMHYKKICPRQPRLT